MVIKSSKTTPIPGGRPAPGALTGGVRRPVKKGNAKPGELVPDPAEAKQPGGLK
jgi:hypothetical protein